MNLSNSTILQILRALVHSRVDAATDAEKLSNESEARTLKFPSNAYWYVNYGKTKHLKETKQNRLRLSLESSATYVYSEIAIEFRQSEEEIMVSI